MTVKRINLWGLLAVVGVICGGIGLFYCSGGSP